MGLLSNTNIVVDDFLFAKRKESQNYIYFLSHMHSDHYKGISNKWNFGPIYCSKMTSKLLLRRYPRLKNVHPLELNKKYTLFLDRQETLKADVILFDANHIFGSVMFLFEGYFGRYLHTGDFRFDEYMWKEYTYLFPPSNPPDPQTGIPTSLRIDQLILDNTFCDPVFKFPKRVVFFD